MTARIHQPELVAGRHIVASVSGGKDSAAMSLALKDAGLEHDRVFMDTGWESPITYAYVLRYDEAFESISVATEWEPPRVREYLDAQIATYGEAPLQQALGPITRLVPEKRMSQLVQSKGMFMSRTHRFCTQFLKVFPMQKHIAAILERGGMEIVNAVGIRAGESAPRSTMGPWEWSDGFDCETWRPILYWSVDDVIEIHRRHDLRPNPLYLQGATRVGCWPCIFARKAELRMLSKDTERVSLIRRLEGRVAGAAAERYAAKGETFESLGYLEPRFFQRMQRSDQERMWPIDKVLAWAATDHGGRQFELFAPPDAERGCMRWGLCETDAPNDSSGSNGRVEILKGLLREAAEEQEVIEAVSTSDEMNELARSQGFVDGADLVRLVTAVDLTIPGRLEAFEDLSEGIGERTIIEYADPPGCGYTRNERGAVVLPPGWEDDW